MANQDWADRCGDGLGEPAKFAYSITPNDGCVLLNLTRCLYVGVAGNLCVQMFDETIVTFIGVPAGTFIPIRVLKVMSTGTTASGVLGLY